MKTQHTLGPWHVQPIGSELYIEAQGPKLICDMQRNEGENPLEVATIDANARLISAAPDLLEAVRKSLIRLEHYCSLLQKETLERRADGLPQSVEVEFCCQQISANRAAITKATQQSP